MEDFRKDIIDVLKRLIFVTLAPPAVAIGSKLATGSWLKWFEFLPLWVWFFLVTLVFCSILIFKRYKVVGSYGKTELASGSIPPHGWERLPRTHWIHYDGVVWPVLRDGRGRDANRLFRRNDRPREICIKPQPACPHCETELKETQRFWGGFTWHCIGCEFKKHSKVKFDEASEKVKLLARRNESTTGLSSDG